MQALFEESDFGAGKIISDETGLQLFARGRKTARAKAGRRRIPGVWTRNRIVETSTSSESVERWLADKIAEKLKISPADIQTDRPFHEYGLNSLTMIEIGLEVEKRFGVKTTSQSIFNNDNIQKFSRYINNASEKTD